jgi:transporter family protein
MDYRIYALIALIFWGIWAYLSKILAGNMKTELLAFYTTLGSLIIVAIYTLIRTKIIFNSLSVSAMLVGALAMIATFAFYAALAKGPASVIVPWTGLYIIIPVVLGIIFLGEKITVNRIIGIIAAVVSIIFLSK